MSIYLQFPQNLNIFFGLAEILFGRNIYLYIDLSLLICFSEMCTVHEYRIWDGLRHLAPYLQFKNVTNTHGGVF